MGKKEHSYYIYITTNPTKTALYVGVTNNLVRRLVQHYLNRGKPDTHAGKYYCYNLLYCEWFQYINNAIAREKELKTFTRQEKEELINTTNPQRRFLNIEMCDMWPPSKELIEAVALLPAETIWH